MMKTASLLRRALRGFILGRYRGSSLDPVRIRLPYSGELPAEVLRRLLGRQTQDQQNYAKKENRV